MTLRLFAAIWTIALMAYVIVKHVAYLIYIWFKPAGWDKKAFFNTHPTKVDLIMYYVVIITFCVTAIVYKVDRSLVN